MGKKKLIILIVSIVAVILIGGITGAIIIHNNLSNNSEDNAKSETKVDNNKKDDDNKKVDNNKKVSITPSANKTIKYETYNNGLVSMQIPKGWKVDAPSVGYASYTFKVYNPSNPDYKFLFCIKLTGFLKSEGARAKFAELYPSSLYGKISAVEPQTTEAFYKVWSNNAKLANDTQIKYDYFPCLNEFTVVENLGKLQIGGDVLRATFKNEDGKLMQGLFTASVTSSGSYYMYGYDLAPLDVYHTFMMMAPDEDFVNYQEIYDYCIGTITFSDSFVKGFMQESNTTVAVVQANAKIYDQMSDMIMDSWEKRNNSYDIISQKRSDATLGYERVYDTETGDVYKAYNGFTDKYTESRYQAVTDDMYTIAISGYIEK